MSADDVVPSEMASDNNIADEQLERFVTDLRSTFTAQTPTDSETHLTAMFESAHLLADKGDPAARPVSNADVPATQVSRLPKRRSHNMTDKNLWRSRGLRVLAPAIAAFTVLGVMASANALPRTIQHAAASAASLVGVDLPGNEDATDAPETADTQAPDAFDDVTTDTTGDDQGEDTQDATDATSEDNNQGEDTQDATDATSEDNNQGEDSQGEDTQGENEQDSTDTSGDTHDGQTGDNSGSDDTTNEDSGNSGSGSQTSGSSGDSGESSGGDSGDDSGSDGGN